MRVEAVNGVKEVRKSVSMASVMRWGENVEGVLFKGIESEEESFIRVPGNVAEKLGLSEGDRPYAFFIGKGVKIRRFEVKEIYDPEVDLGAESFPVYVNIGELESVAESYPDIEVILDDNLKDNASMDSKSFEIGLAAGQYALPLTRLYSNIFSWLDLLDANVLAILVLLSVVAGFNMISALLIMLFRNIPTIGILKTMGMSDWNIALSFLGKASSVVLKGMIVGNVLAVLLCFLQDRIHLVTLDAHNYFISYVPVQLDLPYIIAADVAAYVVIMLLLLLPSLFISRVDPAKTVRQN